MPILIHNNPQYIESLKAKRISDKLSREKPKCNTHKYKQPVYKGLVTKYNNGSNTMFSWNSRK